MEHGTHTSELGAEALFTKELFLQLTKDGTIKKKPLFNEMNDISWELTANPASSYYVDDQRLREALSATPPGVKPALDPGLLAIQKELRKKKSNANAMLHQMVLADAGSSARSISARFKNDLTVVVTSKIPATEQEERIRFEQLLAGTLANIAKARAEQNADEQQAHRIDFQTAQLFKEEVYVVGYLFPLLRHGIAPRIARNVMLAQWGQAPSKIEVHLVDEVQRTAVQSLLLECVRQHHILKGLPVPDESALRSMWEHAHAPEVQAVQLISGGRCAKVSVQDAYVRLNKGRGWYRASINASLPRLSRERVNMRSHEMSH